MVIDSELIAVRLMHRLLLFLPCVSPEGAMVKRAPPKAAGKKGADEKFKFSFKSHHLGQMMQRRLMSSPATTRGGMEAAQQRIASAKLFDVEMRKAQAKPKTAKPKDKKSKKAAATQPVRTFVPLALLPSG